MTERNELLPLTLSPRPVRERSLPGEIGNHGEDVAFIQSDETSAHSTGQLLVVLAQ